VNVLMSSLGGVA